MKEQKDVLSGLSHSDLLDVLHYDKSTGRFTWKVQLAHRWPAGTIAGSKRKDGYVSITIRNQRFLAHRLAWFYVHGCWPKSGIDHINGNTSDNRISNLRDATPHQNHCNLKTPSNNTSGRRGVWWCKRRNKWNSEIMVHQKKVFLGAFDKFDDAVAARASGEAKCYGEFAGVR